ncbi:MAG: response regulator [Bryobacteraceae bacterium]
MMPVTVLIVDDAESCAETLEIALLALPNVEILQARNGNQAWQMLQSKRVSAIITDLHMAGMDGFELIERLRADSNNAGMPLIAVSGDTDPETPSRVRQLGADAYFPKPYSPGAVRATLERLLHAYSSHTST